MIVIAHRGASGYLPEHTLAAKALAYAMGADYIEQDVVVTKDNRLVVLHDIHLDTVSDVASRFPNLRRDDGKYYVIDFTLCELRQLRLTERFDRESGRAVFPERFAVGKSQFTIATLAEEIELIQGLNKSMGRIVGIYPEIKRPAWHREQGKDISVLVLAVLEQYGYARRQDPVFVQCFDWRETRRIRNQLKCDLKLIQLIADSANDAQTATADFLSEQGLAKIANYADGIGPSLSQIVSWDADHHARVSDVVRLAHAHNLVVHPYTLRADQLPAFGTTISECVGLLQARVGIDGIFTDHPDRVVQSRKS